MVVVGAVCGWAHNAIKCASVAPRPGRPVGLYECGQAAGMGVRSYAAVVGDWTVCGRVHDATERSSVDARPGRPSGGVAGKGGVDNYSQVGRRAAFDADNVWYGQIGRPAVVSGGKVWLAWSDQQSFVEGHGGRGSSPRRGRGRALLNPRRY